MAKQENKATPLTEEQLIKKEAELKIQSENLAKEKADFDKEKAAFEKEKEEYLNSKTSVSEEKADTLEEFEYDGEKYVFAPGAPEIIRYGGQKFTRSEILDNEDVLLELIGGNSSLIKKID